MVIHNLKNNRPTLNGYMLNKFLRTEYVEENSFSVKDYILKPNGEKRDNAFLVDVQSFIEIVSIGSKLFKLNKTRENVFYSGDYETDQYFYTDRYKEFKKQIILYSTMYDSFVKLDIKNFYKSIKLHEYHNDCEKTMELIAELMYLFDDLGIKEYPVINDNIGLSYIATNLVLEKLDTEIRNFFESNLSHDNKNFEFIRYSDDAYIFFNSNYFKLEENQILSELKIIFEKNKFVLNDDKFAYDEVGSVSSYISELGYLTFFNGENIEFRDILEDDLILEKMNLFVNSICQIKSRTDYIEHLKILTIESGKIKKNIFNEILYCSEFSDKVSNLSNKQITNIIEIIEYEPVNLCKMILKQNSTAMKSLLHKLYINLEKSISVDETIIALTVYLISRKVKKDTKLKIISKIEQYDSDYSYFLNKIF
jgi:hypothetical protein